VVISRGTLHELQWRGNFADTWYLYCGPMVFICAVSLTLVKNAERAPAPVLSVYFAPLAGDLRFSRAGDPRAANRGVELKSWPLLDISGFCRHAGSQPAAVDAAAKNRYAPFVS
jgi:hypothetical protein